MRFYDIYNGDADGICALVQLRLSEPRDAILVTGVKRDIRLLEKVEAARGDRMTVLDISLDSNRAALDRALAAGAAVEWFDHHNAGEIPSHANFTAHIDTDPSMCTSLIVDRHLRAHPIHLLTRPSRNPKRVRSTTTASVPTAIMPAKASSREPAFTMWSINNPIPDTLAIISKASTISQTNAYDTLNPVKRCGEIAGRITFVRTDRFADLKMEVT